MKYTHEIVGTHGGALLPKRAAGACSGSKTPRVYRPSEDAACQITTCSFSKSNDAIVKSTFVLANQPWIFNLSRVASELVEISTALSTRNTLLYPSSNLRQRWQATFLVSPVWQKLAKA